MSGGAYVAVCGPGVANEQELAWAEEVGRLVARAGAVLVCGGTTGSWTRRRKEQRPRAE
jgi:predicted Rossmann-fold nucleotide-binding protein